MKIQPFQALLFLKACIDQGMVNVETIHQKGNPVHKKNPPGSQPGGGRLPKGNDGGELKLAPEEKVIVTIYRRIQAFLLSRRVQTELVTDFPA
ncbi:MAG: hypothetical protein HQ519_08515 [Planctomycetes bacterium]|nr:hypothetical protein [Planctomycetota bacterium]